MAYLKNFTLISIFLLSVSAVFLHHGWANYDQTNELDFETAIEESLYENPHVTAKVKYEEKMWTVILAPSSRMTSRGVSAEMIKKGTPVRVVAYPHKEGKAEMRAESIYIDGEKYELR